MFVVDAAGTVIHASDEFAAQLGADAAALRGRPLSDFVGDGDWPDVRGTLDAVRRASGWESRRCRCRLSAGDDGPAVGDAPAEIDIELEFAPYRGGDGGGYGDGDGDRFDSDSDANRVVGAVCREPSEPTTARLHTERDRFDHLFDLIDDAVIEFEIVGIEPVVRAVNPGFESVFGYDADEVRGESLNDFIVPPDADDEAVDFDQRTADGKANHAVVTRQTAWGRREFLYRGIPYSRGDGKQYGFSIYSDITSQRRAREHLQVLQRVLRHNLRNEMNVVLGMAEEIREATADSHVDHAAARIAAHTETLLRVSEKARTAAAVLDDQRPDEVVDATETVRAVVEPRRTRFPAATFDLDLPPSLPVSVGPKLAQALANVVENALEHTPEDVTVRIEAKRCENDATLRVSDDGDGIPEIEWAAVFGDEDITQLSHGSGLGLWVVKWVVESAGGRVDYDRRDGWSTVQLTLPLADGSR
ncbi:MULTISPECIES: PAS domain-containing sensor histidine kinase [unclassified Haloferax]|uniref:sensor histidine kinase n=1 Tax=unclassified Haloferax TaxID=2625095 RepID=UPI000E256B49|nr:MULTISPECIES: PAS domain-containing sensor histidine kinase [unclassified Haloferax]RDZ37738.1 PAS domain-containing sensor histidine kinase [Haloferax sp. Atlit-24N]RLM38534.1 PAS domain-containing sensor histidine kinase [Haloferax sp. Atlit-109R]RLM46479.1 PAS domain-containing sensor histidine kinase [Haloferax sp. Atlit-105R]